MEDKYRKEAIEKLASGELSYLRRLVFERFIDHPNIIPIEVRVNRNEFKYWARDVESANKLFEDIYYKVNRHPVIRHLKLMMVDTNIFIISIYNLSRNNRTHPLVTELIKLEESDG